jgi:hypothetical protein
MTLERSGDIIVDMDKAEDWELRFVAERQREQIIEAHKELAIILGQLCFRQAMTVEEREEFLEGVG